MSHAELARALLDEDGKHGAPAKRERALIHAVLAVADALSGKANHGDTGPAESAALDIGPGFVDTRHDWGDDEWKRKQRRQTA